ncbi:MAG: glycosyltransferase family 4 protein [Chloroflexota bacterium]|nr:glycosyltransferase family 4 protein [Chloroflexota bacterium]
MKVLMASKALVMGAYHAKLVALGAQPGIELLALAPESWIEGGRRQRAEPVSPEHYGLRYQPLRLNGRFHLHWWPGLAGAVREFQPDLVHIDEEPYNAATVHACRIARSRGARVVFFAWQNIRRRYPPPFAWFERYVFGRAAGIAGTATAGDVLRAKGFAGPLAVIPQFGVDPERFAPGDDGGGSTFRIGFAGRLVHEKGIELLVEAARRIDGDVELLIAGAGPLDDAIGGQAAGDDRVRLLGALPSAEMPGFYRDLDVLVLPTLGRRGWTEQFGRAAIEAMACGVSVIVSDAGELPAVVGQAGRIVPAGDVEALQRALTDLRVDASERSRLAEAGRARVLAEFTHARIAETTAAFYREVMDGPDR